MENIYYSSTRGSQNRVLASQAILQGIADDGGLFVPESMPAIGRPLSALRGMDYKGMAYFVMSKFFTDFTEDELKGCIHRSYNEKFDSREIAPLVKVGDVFFLELFHGPTLAFKDMALSILPHLLKTAAKKQGINNEIVILTATSGDTGKAALEGFSDVEGTKIIVFFPEDGVSEIQKRQMTTHRGQNTCVIGIKGNFDDAQSGVKDIFGDSEFNKLLHKNNYMFSSANSINIGRLVPQIVYYFHAYLNMYTRREIGEGEKINVVVPTGNFGNILAAYYAKCMGLPINKLICASNDNKVLYDFFGSGTYDRQRKFVTTISPSMDILISSNLERLLHMLCGRNGQMVRNFMEQLKSKESYTITPGMMEGLKDFYGGFATEEDTRKAIREVFRNHSYLMDTHTAVAYHVYKNYVEQTGDETKTVLASTASPYKFTRAVLTSIDDRYADQDDFALIKEMSKITGLPIPETIKDIETRPVIHYKVCEKAAMMKSVMEFLGL